MESKILGIPLNALVFYIFLMVPIGIIMGYLFVQTVMIQRSMVMIQRGMGDLNAKLVVVPTVTAEPTATPEASPIGKVRVNVAPVSVGTGSSEAR